MGISVNGVDITDERIQAELAWHQQAANPLGESVHEVVLRTLLLQQADLLGVDGATEDDRIEALFAREVAVPEPDMDSCLRFYTANLERFSPSPLVEARHILFQVTPNAPLALLRETAGAVFDELRRDPDRFGELAARYSNCPSGAQGGSLGQLSRGQCVPEFEQVLFRLAEGQFAPRPVESRFGLHIVQVTRRIDGAPWPFELVRQRIADHLSSSSWQRALHQYLRLLAGRAAIEGIELDGAATPLVQ